MFWKGRSEDYEGTKQYNSNVDEYYVFVGVYDGVNRGIGFMLSAGCA
jgi:hypothetical protein